MVYIVIYKEDNTLARPIAFSTREKAEEFCEYLRDKYVENMSKKFKREVPASFRNHLQLEIVELEVE